jgi:hypothetical protein
MNETFLGTLRGNEIEWTGPSPADDHLSNEGRSVVVTLLSPKQQTGQGKRMAAALERLALAGGCRSIPDPIAWERAQREDRDLPGRERHVD